MSGACTIVGGWQGGAVSCVSTCAVAENPVDIGNGSGTSDPHGVWPIRPRWLLAAPPLSPLRLRSLGLVDLFFFLGWAKQEHPGAGM
eukprot:2140403-Karenia_brevis.AAC.1